MTENDDQPERYRGNLRHPLIRTAALHQALVRVYISDHRERISKLITDCQVLHARDEVLTHLITQSSDPTKSIRDAALDALDRLFNREPDGMLPAQEPYQRSEDDDETQAH